MKRRSALAPASILALIAAVTASSPAAEPCPPTGQTLARSAQSRLYTDQGALYACAAGTARRLEEPGAEIQLPRIEGRFAAYVVRSPGYTAVRLHDLETGGNATFSPPAPAPEETPPEGLNDGEVLQLVLGSFGRVAWLAENGGPFEVHRGDLANRSEILDGGYEINPDKLDLSRGRLVWRNAGKLRRGDLDGMDGDLPPIDNPRLRLVPGTSDPVGPGPVLWRYGVEVEAGIPVDGRRFAADVERILSDPRGWTGPGAEIALQRVDQPPFDFRVTLAKPRTTDRLCFPLLTRSRVSCQNRGRSVLNELRWIHGSVYWGPRARYREYLVNHEVGHSLGHHHRFCSGRGRAAPIMQQGTGSVAPCRHSHWPQRFERRLTAAP